MKAMLDPRIVAARIHGSEPRAHGAAAGVDLMMPSSHGCVKIFAIVRTGWCGLIQVPTKRRYLVSGPGVPARSRLSYSSRTGRIVLSARSGACRKQAGSERDSQR